MSPLLTAIFALFYPLQMVLHMLVWADLTDGMVLALLEWAGGQPKVEFITPFWFAALYVVLSLFAVMRSFALYLQIGMGLLFLIVLVEKVA